MSYVQLLRTPRLVRLTASQLLARLPAGMMALALLLHINKEYDSYTVAGAVVGAVSIGQALSAPVISRAMLRFGLRPVLIGATVVNACAVCGLALQTVPVWAAVLTGFAIGVSTPPIEPAFRAAATGLVERRHRSKLFAFDASSSESIWVVGPLLTALIIALGSPAAALVVSAAVSIVGGVSFAYAPGLSVRYLPRGSGNFGAVLKNRAVMIAVALGLLLVGSNAAIEAALAATFAEPDPRPGILLALWSASSLVGGLVFGGRLARPAALGLAMAGVTAGAASLFLACDFWSLTALLVVSGLAIAPALAALFSVLATRLEDDSVIEAYGWLATAQRIGFGLGSFVAGYSIDTIGVDGALWTAVVFAALGTAVAFAGSRRHLG